MGYWPTTAGHTQVLHRLYYAAAALGVTITFPPEGGLVVVDNPTITWDIDSGVQFQKRVRIYAPSAPLTAVYDSATDTTPNQFDAVTGGILQTGVTGYLVRVEVLNTDGLIGVAQGHFNTTFQPSSAVESVRLQVFGHKCTQADVELPRIRVQWDQVVPAGSEIFNHYDVLRREAGTSEWDSIRQINDIATTAIDDYNFAPGVTYEYAVIWTANTGTDALVSLPQTTPPAATVEWDWTFLHDVFDPTNWVVFFSFEADEDRVSDRDFKRLWGRTKPTLFVGEDDHITLRIRGLPDVYHGTIWDDTERLYSMQAATGTTICVRRGKQRRVNFCGFADVSRSQGQEQYEPTVNLVEVNFDEALLVEA